MALPLTSKTPDGNGGPTHQLDLPWGEFLTLPVWDAVEVTRATVGLPSPHEPDARARRPVPGFMSEPGRC